MKQLAFVLVTMLAAATVRAGSIWTEYFDCSPEYKMYSLSWKGPWESNHLTLQQNTTNFWSTWKDMFPVQPSGCLIPVTNLRWYRILMCPPCTGGSNELWVPNQRCDGGGQPNGDMGSVQ